MAFWVVSFHVTPTGLGFFRITSYGYLAVDVFFIMSGFVLSLSHREEFSYPNWATTLRFLRLRWWRTYPLYAASILLSLTAFVLLRHNIPDLKSFLVSVLLLEGWAAPGIRMNTPVWSLGVEWLGYLGFPIIAWSCCRLSSRGSAIVAVLAIFAEMSGLLLMGDELGSTIGLGAITRMSGGFIAGYALAAIDRPMTTLTRSNDYALVAVLLGIMGVLSLGSDVYCLPLMAYGVWLVAWPGPLTSAILSSSVALFLGRISFALYLCHWPILKVVQAWQPQGVGRLFGLACSLGAIAVSMAVAYLLCRIIEEPMRRFGRHIVTKRAVTVG